MFNPALLTLAQADGQDLVPSLPSDTNLTPSAPGEAPHGFETTGDGRFNALWTFVGTPAVNLPVAKGSSGLPIGIQVVGRYGEDGRLVRNAAYLERLFAQAAGPGA